MTQLNAATFSAFILTAIALYILSSYPFLPPWAIFISWACFFHMDGGVNRNQAYFATIMHLGLGITAAWLSALAVLNNPFSSEISNEFWAPVIIGLMISMLSRMGAITRFSVTPAIIYGYAATFAFLSATGAFTIDVLLSLSSQNAIVALAVSIVIGASAGYINTMLVKWLSELSLRRIHRPDAAIQNDTSM